MGKSSLELPDVPPHWKADLEQPAKKDWPNYVLPDGQSLKEIIQQRRSKLQDAVTHLQNSPETLDGGLSYAAGHYLSMAFPHHEIDFKNSFAGKADPTELGNAGNFTYYAIGSGILPDTVLDRGASAYNLYKHVSKQSKDGTGPFEPDASAQSIRDQALIYGAGLK